MWASVPVKLMVQDVFEDKKCITIKLGLSRAVHYEKEGVQPKCQLGLYFNVSVLGLGNTV